MVRLALRFSRISAVLRATAESFFSSVVSSPLMGSGKAPVGSTPPESGRFMDSRIDPFPVAPWGVAAAGVGAAATISSLASAASARAAAGFHPPSASAPRAGSAAGASGARCGSATGSGARALRSGRGTGDRNRASSATEESGAQSAWPELHTSVSGPTSPASHRAFTPSGGMGPTCWSSMATYHSVGIAAGAREGSAGGAGSSGGGRRRVRSAPRHHLVEGLAELLVEAVPARRRFWGGLGRRRDRLRLGRGMPHRR